MPYTVFDRLSIVYDSWYEKHPNAYRSELDCVKSLGLGGRALDLGCGTGRFTTALSGLVVCADPSYRMLLIAARRGAVPVQCLGENLPFMDAVFDSVLMVVTLCFVDDPVAVLREAARVLRPGGTVAVCIVPRDTELASRYAVKALRSESPFYMGARFYTEEETIYMAWLAGLRYRYTCSTLSPGNDLLYYEPPAPGRRGAFRCMVFEKPG